MVVSLGQSRLLDPLVPAAAHAVVVIAVHERAVTVKVNADCVPRTALWASALIRKRRESLGIYAGGCIGRRCHRAKP